MGEVYRARDTKLKRDVALKVLPDAFARDPGRMLRFQREAEVLASLNHPNIAHIYGVEDRALIMELVEGESPKGPMPFDDAWKIAMQIADALEYAHERGVIHRDLKPANVKVTSEGVVKLLDFGLAKALSQTPDSVATDPENSPTVTLGETVAGTVLGTGAYMAPEQAKGKRVDKRADIWSWGVVLYELLTGERLFKGEDTADTLAAVIHKQPDFERVPLRVRELLEACLRKDPRQRLRDIGDAKRLLTKPAPVAAPSRSRAAWAAASLLALVAAGLGFLLWRATRPLEHSLVRLDVDLGPDVSLPRLDNNSPSVVISPEGNRIAYLASVAGGPTKLFTRRLDQAKATELNGTEGATSPFFSRDSQWIGFSTAPNALNKISVEGGAVVLLSNLQLAGGASWYWAEDGTIMGIPGLGGSLTRISPGGGTPEPLTELAKGEVVHAFPQILPGEKAVLFVTYNTANTMSGNIEVLTLADRRRKIVMPGGTSPRYLPTGHLIYTKESTLFAVPFDLDKLEARTAVPILPDVAHAAGGSKAAQYDVSSTGVFVYRKMSSANPSQTMTLQWLDSNGNRETLPAKPGPFDQPRFSLKEDALMLTSVEPSGRGFLIYDWRRNRLNRFIAGAPSRTDGVWTPNGEYVVVGSLGNGMSWTRPDQPGQEQPLTHSNNLQAPSSFRRDGKELELAFVEVSGGKAKIRVMPVEDDGTQLRAAGEAKLFRDTASNDFNPRFSPNGRWLAYVSDETGKREVSVQNYPSGGIWSISNGGGGESPVWSPKTNELFYQSGDEIMVVKYKANGNKFDRENPVVWAKNLGGVQLGKWDVEPNGKRLLVLTPVVTGEAAKPDHEVTFLLNFFDYLRQKVPVNK